MQLKIAIQPDQVVHANGERQSFSSRWAEKAKAENISVIEVDVFGHDALSQIAGCHAFMWRFGPTAFPRLYGRRLLFAIEKGLDIPVFPNHKTAWHLEDKILQNYYLSLAGVPIPKTWVCWTLRQAEKFCREASYPLVLKLASGFQATNVRLLKDADEGVYYAERLFGHGVTSLDKEPDSFLSLYYSRLRSAAKLVLKGKYPNSPTGTQELQQGYFYVQEFLPGNEFDTRVTIIGNRAFAFRRFNRPGDFRASGSGRIDWDPQHIDERGIRLAYRVSRLMNAQTVAVDIIYNDNAPIIVELTLTYAAWAVRDCPGHWVIEGEPATGNLTWCEGCCYPEDAIFDDFMGEVRQKKC